MARQSSRLQPELAWAVGTAEMPTFIDDGIRAPFRPVLAAVVSGDGLVLGHGVAGPEAPETAVLEALQQALDSPVQGGAGGVEPSAITVQRRTLQPVVERLFPGIPVRVGRSTALEAVFELLPGMLNGTEPQGIQGLESYLSADVTPELVASFFAASKELYEHQPWALFPDDRCWFTISSQALGMRRWCGTVIGQDGESYGVLLFESERAQQRFFEAAGLTDDISCLPAELLPHQRAISFEPRQGLAPPLIAEIEQHRWPVADGDGFPVPIHVDPDFLYVPTTKVELARLEAVARALCRLIDTTPELPRFWSRTADTPLRKQLRLPIQNEAPISVTITLLPGPASARG